MAAEENKGKGTSGSGTSSSTTSGSTGGSSAGQAASTATGGQQISGEQIFTTTEESKSGESFATTGAGETSGTSKDNKSGDNKSGDENKTNLSDAVTDAVSGDTSKAKDMLNQAKSATGQVASQALGQVQDKASTFVDEKTSEVARGLTGIADSVRQFTENLRSSQDAPIAQKAAEYSDTVVTQIEQFADYLDRADLNKLSRDVETFARRNPAAFIGGAFALGIVAARFIKSSQQRATTSASRQLSSGSNRGKSRNKSTGGSTTSTATGEPPALGKALPSAGDTSTTDTSNQGKGTTPTV